MTAAARIPATARTAARLVIPGQIIRANTYARNRIQAEAELKSWRTATARHWKEDYGPDWMIPPIEITAWAHNRRPIDTDAPFPTLKAAIDGLRDCGALGDDAARWIAAITLLAYTPAPHPALVITLQSITTGPPPLRIRPR